MSDYKPSIINISLDQSLLSQSGVGDSLERFRHYAKHLSHFHVLVPTTHSTAKAYSSSNITIQPVVAPNTFQAYYQLIPTIKSHLSDTDLLVSNDPVLGGIAHIARNFSSSPPLQINVFGASVTNPFWHQERLLNRLYAPYIVWALKHANSIRCDSSLDKQALVKHLSLNPKNILVIPVPPSPKIQQLFLSAQPIPAFNQYPRPLLVTVAHLLPNKDYSNLILAASQLRRSFKQFTWIIVGRGPLEAQMLAQIKKHQLACHIHLVGQLAYQELPGLLKSADLYVSSSYLEGLPRVIMEACLAQTPVVSTATTGVHDLIQDQVSGRIVPVKDPKALASAIQHLLNHPQIATAYAHKAHSHALKYLDFDTNVHLLVNSWQKLARKKATSNKVQATNSQP